MGKATVLKILHAAEVPIKPAGRHYWQHRRGHRWRDLFDLIRSEQPGQNP
jgi:hypothetical protein